MVVPSEVVELHSVQEWRALYQHASRTLSWVHFVSVAVLYKKNRLYFVCMKSVRETHSITPGLDEMSFPTLIRSQV